jgi:hypothetical protein
MRLSPFLSFIIATLLLCQPLLAQDRVWRVGIHAGTGHYQLYNKNDWNADPILIYPVKSEPTNWTVGATTHYNWGKHWGVGSGLLLSKNRQEFRAERNPSSPFPPGSESYSIKNEFNYLKLPVTFQFSTNNLARHQFRVSIGLQTSFLLSYRERFLQTNVGFRSESETHNKVNTDLSPNTSGQVFFDRFWYSRFLIGSVAEFAYSFQTSDNWLISVGLRGEYDFTNAENHKARRTDTGQFVWTSSLKRVVDDNIADRPKTLNRSVGLFLSVCIPVAMR